MNIDTEQRLGIMLPKGKNINPAITGLIEGQGIGIVEIGRNGSLHGNFEGFEATWTQADSGNIIPEIARGTTFQAGFVGSDFLADYMASVETPKVEELLRFELFDPRMRLSVLVRDDPRYQSGEDLKNSRFLSRYLFLARNYFKQYFPDEQYKKIPVSIDTTVTGGEERFVYRGAAEGCMVIVNKGWTMEDNELKELAVIEHDIQPVFVANLQAVERRKNGPAELGAFLKMLQNDDRGSRRLAFTVEPPLIPA